MRRWGAMLAVAVIAGGAVGTAVAYAGRVSATGSSAAGAIKQVKTEWSEALVGTSSTGWVPVASVRMRVPTGEKDLIVARFDGMTYCDPNTPGVGSGACQLRILAKSATKTVTLLPFTMRTVLEVTSGVGQDDYSLTMEKSRVLPAGRWTILVQHRVDDPSIYFGISAHHLTVERAPV